MIKRARVLMQFGSGAGATQHQNRGADRGPQAGSPLGVVDATGSSPVIVKKRKSTVPPRLRDFADDPVATTTPAGLAGDPGPLLFRNSCRGDQLVTHGKCLFLHGFE